MQTLYSLSQKQKGAKKIGTLLKILCNVVLQKFLFFQNI
jgi:hypothetical protein